MEKKLTIKEIADFYSVTPMTIRNWIKKGLPSIKVGNVLRFDVKDTDEWLKQQNTNK